MERAPCRAGVKRAIRDNPVDFPEHPARDRRAEKIRCRRRTLVVDRPHVVMGVEVHEYSILDAGLVPDAERGVMELEHSNRRVHG